MEFVGLDFWSGLLSIILINLVLSGDNAVIIAMVSRRMPVHQQKKAIIIGCLAAILMRLVLVAVAVWLLKIPLIKAAGGVLLVWIALSLLDDKTEIETVGETESLYQAVKTIIFADFIMSVDNVLAIAGVAEDNLLLLLIGLLISMPIIAFGSNFLLGLMEKFPVVILAGAAILGYTAGEMLMGDIIVGSFFSDGIWSSIIPPSFAVIIVLIDVLRSRRRQ